jgi:hypothetical protein
MGLIEYIAAYYNGNQRTFAESQCVKPPQVTQWIAKKFIVVDRVLYSPRRELTTIKPHNRALSLSKINS